LTSNEAASERYLRKKHNKRAKGDPLKQWKARRTRDHAPFDDEKNEWGIKRGDKLQNGTKFGLRQYHKMKKGGFV
jgi:hypothetical protein